MDMDLDVNAEAAEQSNEETFTANVETGAAMLLFGHEISSTTQQPEAGKTSDLATAKSSQMAISTADIEVSLLNVIFDTAALNRKQCLAKVQTIRERERIRNEEMTTVLLARSGLRTKPGRECWSIRTRLLRWEGDCARIEEKWGLF